MMSTCEALRFLVSCRHCQRPVITVAWSAAELAELERHARRCAPDALGATPAADETLRHFRVVPVQQD
jgi:hypothetical protein